MKFMKHSCKWFRMHLNLNLYSLMVYVCYPFHLLLRFHLVPNITHQNKTITILPLLEDVLCFLTAVRNGQTRKVEPIVSVCLVHALNVNKKEANLFAFLLQTVQYVNEVVLTIIVMNDNFMIYSVPRIKRHVRVAPGNLELPLNGNRLSGFKERSYNPLGKHVVLFPDFSGKRVLILKDFKQSFKVQLHCVLYCVLKLKHVVCTNHDSIDSRQFLVTVQMMVFDQMMDVLVILY
mmetsp:Transcript_21252/g.31638  ORF Transcript_21252/g.31638 Transcript_21252/m.31638 type:complete len:234 (-) Transcript_21252:1320-2021(-)